MLPKQNGRCPDVDRSPTTIVGWRLYVDLMKRSGVAWVDDRAPTMGAALAFYSAFSLAPLLIIVIAVAGAAFGVDAARGAIVGQLAGLVGAPAAEAIQALLKAAQETRTSIFATVVGLLTMLVGATTILVELQDDLDHIWKAPRRPGSTLLSMLRARVLSLGMILGVGFLLLISLALSGAITAMETYAQSRLSAAALPLLMIWNLSVSVGGVTVLFAMLYKWLPNVPISWKDVWMGAFITACLFSAGRYAIGLYLGRSAVASAYGAAGTLVVLLLWLYYSAQVFLLGAEFTCLFAKHRAHCRSDQYRKSPTPSNA
jgi:membrane protein